MRVNILRNNDARVTSQGKIISINRLGKATPDTDPRGAASLDQLGGLSGTKFDLESSSAHGFLTWVLHFVQEASSRILFT